MWAAVAVAARLPTLQRSSPDFGLADFVGPIGVDGPDVYLVESPLGEEGMKVGKVRLLPLDRPLGNLAVAGADQLAGELAEGRRP